MVPATRQFASALVTWAEARVAATKGRKPRLVPERIEQIRKLRAGGTTVPDIIRQTGLSKASVYRALAGSSH